MGTNGALDFGSQEKVAILEGGVNSRYRESGHRVRGALLCFSVFVS
ncbi:MAG: hypothetical protein JWN98_1936 [Abditibacteriota bacterium]|nr:hypothetical protein [Abditibacteriota bacterium]